MGGGSQTHKARDHKAIAVPVLSDYVRVAKRRKGMLIRGRVPLRLSFSGGGTDVPPFCNDHGGCVLSITINMYAYATVEERDDNVVNIRSLDYDSSVRYDIRKELSMDGKLDLIKAAANYMCHDRGFNLFIHNDAPPGSGLGSSGCIGAMMIGLFGDINSLRLSRDEIAEKAIIVERQLLGVSGGRQDQYAAVYGGCNYMEFYNDRNIVYQLRLDRSIVLELEYHLLLVWTKKKHYSSDLIDEQVKLYKEGNKTSVAGLFELKELTNQMKEALVCGDLNRLGGLMHDAWVSKKKINPRATTPQIDEMYEEARKLGALGGKILGAGGGGYLVLFCPFYRKDLIAKRVQEMGGVVVNFGFEEHGLDIWRVNKDKLGGRSEGYMLSE